MTLTASLANEAMEESWTQDVPTIRFKAAFPFFGGKGTENSALVYFELEPGHELGIHTDSEEEILLVLEGRVEAWIGESSAELSRHEAAVIPAGAPHNVINGGDVVARCVGFFAGASVISRFESPLMPLGERVYNTDDIPI